MNKELEHIRNKINGEEGSFLYVRASGRGRKNKAHIMDEETRKPICSFVKKDDNLRTLDAETVAKFYTVCSYCESKAEEL